jgi:hypothetical protein
MNAVVAFMWVIAIVILLKGYQIKDADSTMMKVLFGISSALDAFVCYAIGKTLGLY